MGLFGTIKLIREEYKKIKKYMSMSYEELCALPDEELVEAISTRLYGEERHKEVDECLKEFKGAKRIYYIVNYFDMEVQNGGLCQYFVNSSRETAPYIQECLHTIGASRYEKLLNDFIQTHGIALDALESFVIEDVEDYEKQTERYPFDDFDDAYYELYENEPLEEMLTKYVRVNLKDFV